MAARVPDPRELKSWQDAFEHPITVVKGLEQQLRTNVNDNRDKVRSLVGSSYRDLLGTADRIIEMNAEMQKLEETFSGIGQRCNSKSINKLATNHARLTRNQRDEQTTRRQPVAEAALLQSSLLACQRTLAADGSPLLAARLLLLARLAQNSATKTTQGARMVSQQRLKVNTFRNKLLAHINHRIGEPNISRVQLLELLLAHALVTSSSLADVFRHVLQIRLQALVDLCESNNKRAIVKAIDLLFSTIDQARAAFPNRMSASIERAMGPNLLSDDDLRAALEFDLDTYERWINKDIRNYVPWLRNNDLPTDVMESALKGWSDKAIEIIVSGLGDLLKSLNRPTRIVKFRERILRHLLEVDAKSDGFSKEPLLLAARDLFVNRLSAVISIRSSSIADTMTSLLAKSIHTSHSSSSLWDQRLVSNDLHGGASSLREQIVIRSQGYDPSLTKLESDLTLWIARLDDVRKTIKEMESLRWVDSLDLDTDLEEDGGRFDTLFSKDDPKRLTEHLSLETSTALKRCLQAVDQAAKSVGSNANVDADHQLGSVLYLLRVLRMLASYLPSQKMVNSAVATTRYIHGLLADSVHSTLTASNPAIDYSKDLLSAPAHVNLWSGSPALPTHPNSRSFRLLRDLCKIMNGHGGDIWSPDAVGEVKQRVRGIVGTAIVQIVDGSRSGEVSRSEQTNGQEAQQLVNGQDPQSNGDKHEDVPNGSEADASTNLDVEADHQPVNQHMLLQALFDALYLDEVLQLPRKQDKDSLTTSVEELRAVVKVDDATYDRVLQSTLTYHKRSYLLFGVLLKD